MATDDLTHLFGQLALRDGLITPEQLEEALRLQREAARGQLLGRILVERGYLKETDVARVYQQQIRMKHSVPGNGAPSRPPSPLRPVSAEPPTAPGSSGSAKIPAAGGAPAPDPGQTPAAPASPPGPVVTGRRNSTGAVPAVAATAGEQKLFGKYLLTEVLGQGRSQTYKVWDSDRKSFLALKIGPTADAPAEEAQRFRQEAEAAATLSHPNIVKVHEVSEIDGRPYVLMDYVMGISLDHLVHPDNRDPADFTSNKGTTRIHRHPKDESLIGEIRKSIKERRPLQRDHLVRLIAEAARAVHQAHDQGVVHRNLKPHNIIADLQGRAIITDFASTQYVSQMMAAGEEASAFAPPIYMAPEMLRPGGDGADRRVDVYSLGAILYESITARPPYQGATRQVIDRIGRHEPTLPSEIHAGVPPGLEAVCLKAMHRKRERRYPTALEFAEDLDRFLYGGDVKAQSDLGAARLWRTLAASRAAHAALGLAMLAGVGFLGMRLLPTKPIVGPRESPEAAQAAAFAAEAAKVARLPGRAKEAFDLYTRAISLQTGTWVYFYERGLCAYAMGRYQSARIDFETCIKRGSASDGARYHLARMFMEEIEGEGTREAALSRLEELLAHNMDSPFVPFARARILALKEEWDKSHAVLEGLESTVCPGEADSVRAWIHLHREPIDLESAVRCCSRSIELAPNDATYLFQRARLLIRLEKYPEARRDLDRAITLSPHHRLLHETRGLLFAGQLNDRERALADLEQVVRLAGEASEEVDFSVRMLINQLRMKR